MQAREKTGKFLSFCACQGVLFDRSISIRDYRDSPTKNKAVNVFVKLYFLFIIWPIITNFIGNHWVMNVATILVAGASLPYHVLDYAINWAKENEGSLHALFILPVEVPSEDYPFPNDLDAAENFTTEVDAKKGIRQALQQEIRFLEKRAKGSHIPVHSEVLFSPAKEQVLVRINQTEIIFMDKKTEDDESLTEGLSFNIEDLREASTRHFVPINEYDRYTDTFY